MSRPSMVKQAMLHKQFLSRNENQVEGSTPSYKLKLKRCTQHLFDLIVSSWVHTSIQGARVSPWWEQWLEHSPPTNVAQASSAGVDAICGWLCFWFSPLHGEFFISGFPVFFPPPTIYFSLGRKRWIHKRSQKKIEIFWFFWLQFCSLRGRCSKGNRKGILGRGWRQGNAC